MPNTFPAPIFPPRACTIAAWWRLNDWRGSEVKRGRLTEKHTLGEAGGDAEGAKKKKDIWKKWIAKERRGGVENTGSMQLQLRQWFCAREYANSSFVWAVDWPLRCTPGGEGRGSGGLGRLCLARRPSQASFSYTIAVSGVAWKKKKIERHTFVICLSVGRHIHPRDVGEEMLAQLASSRDGDRDKDTH